MIQSQQEENLYQNKFNILFKKFNILKQEIYKI
jgi:hypothetical protein